MVHGRLDALRRAAERPRFVEMVALAPELARVRHHRGRLEEQLGNLAGAREHLGAVAAVVRHGMALVGAGLVTGVIGAALLAAAIRGFLFGAGAADPVAFAAAAARFAVVALAALTGPALRATATDPVEVLRDR